MTPQSNASQTFESSAQSNLSYQDSQNSETQITSTPDEGVELTANADGVTLFLPWKDLNRFAKPIGLALTHLAVAASTYFMTNPPLPNSSQLHLNPKQPGQEYFCDRVHRLD